LAVVGFTYIHISYISVYTINVREFDCRTSWVVLDTAL